MKTSDTRRMSPWVMVACGAAIVTLSMGARQAFGLFLLPMSGDIAIDRESFGLAIAIQSLLFGLVQPSVGAAADRHGAGRVIAVGALLYAGGLALAATVGSALGINASLGVLVGLALAGTTFVVVLGAIGRVVNADQRGRAFGIVTAGGSVGQFLVVPFTQEVIDLAGWRETLLVLAGLMLLIVALARGVTGRAPREALADGTDTGSWQALRQASRHSGFLLLNAGFFVCGFHITFLSTHLPAYLGDGGLDATIGAASLALIGLFNIFGSYYFGFCAGRYRKKHVLTWLYLARAGVITLFVALPLSATSALVFSAAIGFLWLGTVPLTSGLVGQIFGMRHLSLLFGVVFMSHQFGSFFGAWAAGWSYTLTGSYDQSWIASIVLALVAAALHWPIRDTPIVAAEARPVTTA
ncbi:MFS transporter [Endozoicomonas sp. G2_2]|uniref:MFS transporter n=1 Tax=Endozoicomonas sp. G2_2 TaxID=2821092 RepID=UPI001ADB016B|nr:MFS transporter [Endozoicomonas sp. G2_2]MBO9470619.1 MFS transporter [Endozoicomonas sp. G2_2]